MSCTDVVIVDARRTAIGNFMGGLSSKPAHELGAEVISTLLKDNKVDGKDVSQVILGQVLTAGVGQNPARQASMAAGIPKEVPAWLVNQVCGSGLRAVALAAQSIALGDSTIVIAGGQENMSLAPHASHLRNGVKMGHAQMTDTMIHDGLWDIFNDYHMGTTAENIATKFNISREEQDKFAAASQQKAEAAQKTGAFKDEIVPVTIKGRKGDTVVEVDEFPRHGTTTESLRALRPAFRKDGTVTAGNASGINDGAAVVLLMSTDEAKKRGLKPLATIKAFAQAGVDPAIMGTGPIPAVKAALKQAGWSIDDLDLIEANEAFAAQAICVNKELGWDTDKVNVSGGAIALGHPIGASGARILTTLLHGMKARDAKKGIATLCVGGGMGVALCVERDNTRPINKPDDKRYILIQDASTLLNDSFFDEGTKHQRQLLAAKEKQKDRRLDNGTWVNKGSIMAVSSDLKDIIRFQQSGYVFMSSTHPVMPEGENTLFIVESKERQEMEQPRKQLQTATSR